MSLYRKVQNVPIVDHLLIHWPPSNSMVHLYMDVCTKKLRIIMTTFIWGGEMMHKPVGRKSRDIELVNKKAQCLHAITHINNLVKMKNTSQVALSLVL